MNVFDTVGLKNNTGTNCYANTVLMSMFLVKSPFHVILTKKVSPEIKTIQEKLQHVIDNINNNCSDLIKSIDMYYTEKNKSALNLLYSMNDVNEFYGRITSLFDFEPMEITLVRQSRKGPEHDIIEEKPVSETHACISIINDNTNFNGLKNFLVPDWQDLGEDKTNWKYNEKDIHTYRFTRNIVNSVSSNCLIFHVNRTSCKVVDGRYSTYKTRNSITMPVDLEMNKEKYIRAAVIVHVSSNISGGHFIAIFYDGKNYYVYDDMNNRKMSECPIDKELVEKLIQVNGSMYFYYKTNY
jgi:hypothetical protein